jgi:hypothetical protein
MQTRSTTAPRRPRQLTAAVAAAAALLIPAGLAQASPAGLGQATPVQIGAGTSPSIVVTSDGDSHVVWEDTDPSGDVWDYCDLPIGASACVHASQLVENPAVYQSDPTIFAVPGGFEVWGNAECGGGIHAQVRYTLDVNGQVTGETCVTGELGGGAPTAGDDFLDIRPGHDWLLGSGDPSADPSFFHAFGAGDDVPGAQVFNGDLGFTYNPSVAESGASRDGSGETLVMAAGRSAADSNGNHAGFAVYNGLASGASIDALNTQANWATGFSMPHSQDVDYSASVHAISGGPDVAIIAATQPEGGGDSILIDHVTRPEDPSTGVPGFSSSTFSPPSADRALITDLQGVYDPHGLSLTWVSRGRLRMARTVNQKMTIQGTVTPLKHGIESENVGANATGHEEEAYATSGNTIMAVPLLAVADTHTITQHTSDGSALTLTAPLACLEAGDPVSLSYGLSLSQHPHFTGTAAVTFAVAHVGTATVSHAPFHHSFTLTDAAAAHPSVPATVTVKLKLKHPHGAESTHVLHASIAVCQ